ncbi:deleted in azoospermia-like isoform X4 [Rhinatrema bivittatum]|uniref:deleted in azoospermia-like isoform X4 n=1 Tax=Rhinatrema bivittatum TaxID=194408 RepID=UPI00112835BD|nr:deleted in azoospermia-like isoform X4 [Rhinatrema bivittatum]
MTTAVPESQTTSITREDDSHSTSATTSQGYVLPEGKIMPNTVFVGGIDIRMDEIEIRDFFARFGAVKEVKIITDRTGVSKGYGFVSYYDDVDVQKIVESQINFHGKKLKLGPAIRKQQNLCAYHVQPRPVILHPPAPQFHNVWNNQNTEPYIQYPPMVSPVTQYVQAYPPYQNSHPVIIQQIPLGYQQPAYNYQVTPQWPAGEQRSYIIPQKSVDRSIQTVVSCLFNPENRLQRNSFVAQDDYLKKYRQAFGAVKNCKTAIFDMQCFTQLNCVLRPKEKRVHQFRRSKAVFKTVPN